MSTHMFLWRNEKIIPNLSTKIHLLNMSSGYQIHFCTLNTKDQLSMKTNIYKQNDWDISYLL